MTRKEIRFSGFGGQGVILMGYITGKAAAIHDNKNATLTQSYGPEARGGSCSAQVVVDSDRINYPMVVMPDILITMSQAAYNAYRSGLKDGGILIYDSLLVTPSKDDKAKAFCIPAKTVATQIGRQVVANIVMLGFMAKVSGVVSKDAMQKAIESSVPPQMREINMEAFQKGWDYPTDSKPKV